MREKHQSPRKMLPSPKKAAIYPTLLQSQYPNYSRVTTDEPLDLRIDYKKIKSKLLLKSSKEKEDENSNIIDNNNCKNHANKNLQPTSPIVRVTPPINATFMWQTLISSPENASQSRN